MRYSQRFRHELDDPVVREGLTDDEIQAAEAAYAAMDAYEAARMGDTARPLAAIGADTLDALAVAQESLAEALARARADEAFYGWDMPGWLLFMPERFQRFVWRLRCAR